MTLKIYVSPTGRLIREDLGKPAEVALADVFRHTLNTQERADALAGVYGDEVRVRVLEIEADTPSGSGGAVSSVAGKTGAVTLVKADVGLGNVDNTSDAAKPISTAQAAVNAALTAADALKADKLSTVLVSAAGAFDLTEAAHAGRRVVATVPGVVFTKTTAWGPTAVGVFLDVDADGTYTLGSGITVPAGCASGSASAAGGAVDLGCVDNVLASKTAALAAQSGPTILKISPAADVASNSTAETLVWEGVLSNLQAGAEVDILLRLGGTGTGNKTLSVKVGGAAGAADGTSLGTLSSTGANWFYRFSLGANADASALFGMSANIINGGATTGAPNASVAIVPANGVRVKVVLTKGVAADVVNLQPGQVKVFQ